MKIIVICLITQRVSILFLLFTNKIILIDILLGGYKYLNAFKTLKLKYK